MGTLGKWFTTGDAEDAFALIDLDALRVHGPSASGRRGVRRDRARFRRNFSRPEDLAWVDALSPESGP